MLCSVGEPLKAEYDREYQAMRQGKLARRSIFARATKKWIDHINVCPCCKQADAQ